MAGTTMGDAALQRCNVHEKLRAEFLIFAFFGTLTLNLWLKFMPWRYAGDHPHPVTVVCLIMGLLLSGAVSIQTIVISAKKRRCEKTELGIELPFFLLFGGLALNLWLRFLPWRRIGDLAHPVTVFVVLFGLLLSGIVSIRTAAFFLYTTKDKRSRLKRLVV